MDNVIPFPQKPKPPEPDWYEEEMRKAIERSRKRLKGLKVPLE